MKPNIVLCGFMGCGKTTVGQHLSLALHLPFYDSDEVIEQQAGKTISQIFAEDGEAAFRTMERQVIAQLTQHQGVIIATGGGVVLDPQNVAALKETGTIYHLDPSVEKLMENLENDHTRPLLEVPNREQRIRQLHRERESRYTSVRDYAICEDLLPNVVEHILDLYQKQAASSKELTK